MKRFGGKDNCSLWPDRIAGVNYSEACARHDADYGAEEVVTKWDKSEPSASRWEADKRLFLNVGKSGRGLKSLLSWPIAAWMWAGVRIGGRRRYEKESN